MSHAPKKPLLRIPRTLAFTTLGCAITATLACSGHTDASKADASADAVAHDAPVECDGPTLICGNGPCPSGGATYCGTQCPPGCDPFV